ncbi:MAG TPA: nucleotide exchange factor GrpE, partial [Pyrinomonadaceae bacterium]
RIPIRFMDAESEAENEVLSDREEDASLDALSPAEPPETSETVGGPDTAELIATRSELKRVEAENAELKNQLARRQADFENFRKRVERERSETYNRVAADIAAKLLPVSDNLKRALEAEASVEAAESDEFRHFLSGVDLIWKQLHGVLEALGVKPIPAVGEPFNPHVHEAVVTEATDEYEPDTVMQEIVTGYRLGDKLIRPALVKVATRK